MTPEGLLHSLKNHIGATREAMAEVEHHLTELQDLDKLKAWLQDSQQPDERERS